MKTRPIPDEKIGIVILAAGSSTRLGEPKQELVYRNETLLQRMVRVANQLPVAKIAVVLRDGIHLNNPENEKTMIVNNENFELGMSSSIQRGLKSLLEKNPDLEAVVITVCDQPFVSTALLRSILDKYQETGLPIVASRYEETVGTPALFDKSIFPELLGLVGDKGAKQVIKKFPGRSTAVDFALGNIDIDTKEDFDRLLKMNEHDR